MHRRILNTCMFLVLFCLVSRSAGKTVASSGVPESMYDILAKKCPLIQKTELKKKDVFTKNCTDWAKINVTEPNKSKESLRCLVYYESIVSFCSDLGQDSDPSIIQLFTMDLSNTDDQICVKEKPIYPRNKTLEHDFSKLIDGVKGCMHLCYEDGNFNEICKSAYYFSNFDVPAFMKAREKVKEQQTSSVNVKDPKSPVEESKSLVKETVDTPTGSIKDQPLGAAAEKQKPALEPLKQTDNTNNNEQQQKDVDSIPKPPEKPPVVDNPEPKKEEVKPDKNVESAKTSPEIKKPEQNKETDDTINIEDPSPSIDESPNEFNEEDQAEAEEEEEDANIKPDILDSENNEGNSQKKISKPNTVEDESISTFNSPDDDMDGDSYFFSYFTVLMCLCILGYVGYHNRQKILALILEGKKGRRSSRGKRPNSANYHKLDSNLEEAISSSCPKNSTNVIY